MAIDVGRIATTAVEALLRDEDHSENGRVEKQHHRLVAAGGVALGVALATGARAAYTRARNLDLEQVAEAVERRLTR